MFRLGPGRELTNTSRKDSHMATREKIRSAKDRVSTAQSALDAAEKGLDVAESAADVAADVRSNSKRIAGLLLLLTVVGVVFYLMRTQDS